jgi:hypothetical protein
MCVCKARWLLILVKYKQTHDSADKNHRNRDGDVSPRTSDDCHDSGHGLLLKDALYVGQYAESDVAVPGKKPHYVIIIIIMNSYGLGL